MQDVPESRTALSSRGRRAIPSAVLREGETISSTNSSADICHRAESVMW